MDWAAHYDALVSRARVRQIDGYSEKHHIIPRCMGGSNAKSNIVKLTAREHFIAHKLLVRMNPDVRGLWFALVAMGRIHEFKSRIFSSERARAAEMRKGFRYTEESRKRMSDSARLRGPNSSGTQFKSGQSPWNAGEKDWRKGYSHSGDTRAKMTATQRANREAHSARMRQWWADRKAELQRTGG